MMSPGQRHMQQNCPDALRSRSFNLWCSNRQGMLSPRELDLVQEINGACAPLLRIEPVADPPSAGPAAPLQVGSHSAALCFHANA